MKKLLVIVALLFVMSCTRIEPANPRPLPDINIGVPAAYPDRPKYEPPPTSPHAQTTLVKHEIEATRSEFLPSEIKIKKGSYVSLDVLAVDIPQRFTMAAYGVDEPLPVGQNVLIEFMADHEGTFVFYSEGHKGMEGKIIVQ